MGAQARGAWHAWCVHFARLELDRCETCVRGVQHSKSRVAPMRDSSDRRGDAASFAVSVVSTVACAAPSRVVRRFFAKFVRIRITILFSTTLNGLRLALGAWARVRA